MAVSPTPTDRVGRVEFEAIAQLANGATPVKLVDIEEPETVFHPAAPGTLRDAPRGAAVQTLVVVATHRPDLPDENDSAMVRPPVSPKRDDVSATGPSVLEAVEEHRDSPGASPWMDQIEAAPIPILGRRGWDAAAGASG